MAQHGKNGKTKPPRERTSRPWPKRTTKVPRGARHKFEDEVFKPFTAEQKKPPKPKPYGWWRR